MHHILYSSRNLINVFNFRFVRVFVFVTSTLSWVSCQTALWLCSAVLHGFSAYSWSFFTWNRWWKLCWWSWCLVRYVLLLLTCSECACCMLLLFSGEQMDHMWLFSPFSWGDDRWNQTENNSRHWEEYSSSLTVQR